MNNVEVKKLIEYTYSNDSGTHYYMRVNANNEIHEIDAYFYIDGTRKYRTTADHDNYMRDVLIAAFNALY